MSATGEDWTAGPDLRRRLSAKPHLKVVLRVGRWLALVGAGVALGAAFLRQPEGGAGAEAAPGRGAFEQLDTLAFRLALLERRAAPPSSIAVASSPSEVLTLLALQELAERVER